jgi:NSS family neurotransmitter:Na+ symporter
MLFFLFMIFASFSTVIAVFENIISFWLELTQFSRTKAAVINIILMIVLSVPCVLSLNLWSDITIGSKTFMDLEDFIVSNLLLPIGSLFYILFCTKRYGWGWDNFIQEVNTGKGLKFPKWLRLYVSYLLPLIIIAILIISVLPVFAG